MSGKKVAAPPRQLAKASEESVSRPSVDGLAPEAAVLAQDIGQLIETARTQVAQAANAALTNLYWEIGTRIRQDVLKQQRAEYGAEIVAALRIASRSDVTGV